MQKSKKEIFREKIKKTIEPIDYRLFTDTLRDLYNSAVKIYYYLNLSEQDWQNLFIRKINANLNSIDVIDTLEAIKKSISSEINKEIDRQLSIPERQIPIMIGFLRKSSNSPSKDIKAFTRFLKKHNIILTEELFNNLKREPIFADKLSKLGILDFDLKSFNKYLNGGYDMYLKFKIKDITLNELVKFIDEILSLIPTKIDLLECETALKLKYLTKNYAILQYICELYNIKIEEKANAIIICTALLTFELQKIESFFQTALLYRENPNINPDFIYSLNNKIKLLKSRQQPKIPSDKKISDSTSTKPIIVENNINPTQAEPTKTLNSSDNEVPAKTNTDSTTSFTQNAIISEKASATSLISKKIDNPQSSSQTINALVHNITINTLRTYSIYDYFDITGIEDRTIIINLINYIIDHIGNRVDRSILTVKDFSNKKQELKELIKIISPIFKKRVEIYAKSSNLIDFFPKIDGVPEEIRMRFINNLISSIDPIYAKNINTFFDNSLTMTQADFQFTRNHLNILLSTYLKGVSHYLNPETLLDTIIDIEGIDLETKKQALRQVCKIYDEERINNIEAYLSGQQCYIDYDIKRETIKTIQKMYLNYIIECQKVIDLICDIINQQYGLDVRGSAMFKNVYNLGMELREIQKSYFKVFFKKRSYKPEQPSLYREFMMSCIEDVILNISSIDSETFLESYISLAKQIIEEQNKKSLSMQPV